MIEKQSRRINSVEKLLESDNIPKKEVRKYLEIDAMAHNVHTKQFCPLEFHDFYSPLSLREAVAIVQMPVDIIHHKVRGDGAGILTRETPELLLLCPNGCEETIPALKPCWPWGDRANYWALHFVSIHDSWRQYSPYTWVLTYRKIKN
jgi:hypothetical protein